MKPDISNVNNKKRARTAIKKSEALFFRNDPLFDFFFKQFTDLPVVIISTFHGNVKTAKIFFKKSLDKQNFMWYNAVKKKEEFPVLADIEGAFGIG